MNRLLVQTTGNISEKGRGSMPKKNDRLDCIQGPAQIKVGFCNPLTYFRECNISQDKDNT